MNPQTRQTVVFDFDGTLTRTDTLKFLAMALASAAPARLPALFRLIRQRQVQGPSPQQFKAQLLSVLVKGRRCQAIVRLLPIYRCLTRLALRGFMWARFAEHLARNDRVVVATASPRFAVDYFLRGLVPVLGAELATENDRYTGDLASPIPYGEEKARQLRQFLGGQSPVDVAYSDDLADLPLLRMSRQAFVVTATGVRSLSSLRHGCC